MATLYWRLRRITNFEAACITALTRGINHPRCERQRKRESSVKLYGRPEKSPASVRTLEAEHREFRRNAEEAHKDQMSKALGNGLLQDSQTHNALEKLARHEVALMNAISRLLKLLFALQSGYDAREDYVTSTRPLPIRPIE